MHWKSLGCTTTCFLHRHQSLQGGGTGAVVETACLESRRLRARPRSGIQVSKKQNVSSPLTHKDSVLWGAYMTEM